MSDGRPVVCFVSASGQNIFFSELLDALREALEATGIATAEATDHFPPLEDDLVYVVVPHEYFALTWPVAHPDEDQLRRTIALETEQPGTHWFNHAVEVAKRCAVTVDINHLGVAELRRRGVDARYLRLGYVPGWDRWGGDPDAERPVDVTFMGGHTERRAIALGRCAGVLSGRRAALHLTETHEPHTEASPHFIAGEQRARDLSRAKVMLNVHRAELGYFEWHRVISAMANGCVVLTEHSIGYRPFEPGRHFVSSAYDNLHNVLEALLGDEERLATIRHDAYQLLQEEVRLDRSIGVLREAAADVLAAAPARELTKRRHRPVRPAPKPVDPRVTEYDRILRERDEIASLRTGVKHLLLEQRELRRELGRRTAAAEGPELTERAWGPYAEATPRVSVLVTVYNYEHPVREALRSVAASSFRDIELVVVDDGSHDGSVQAVSDTLATLPWLPALQVVRRDNAGLAAARNLAAERARGEFVFILDADNAVYPHGLERLVEALDADPGAAFAYGLLEKVSLAFGVVDLVSWLGWDPLRLRYGNFVDAMSMIRREPLLAAGGYTNDFRLHGWEDFALWCAFADAGLRGVRVPEIVARYVAAVHSMISVTNIDAAEAYSALARAHPFMAGAPLRSPAAA